MEEDFLLKELFKPERWESAIDVGIGKRIDKAELRALTAPETRIRLYQAIRDGNYEIAPTRSCLIPKDQPGEFREIFIAENIDRIFMSIVNNMLFEFCGKEMVHPHCMSYQRGIGCGKVVKDISNHIAKAGDKVSAIKLDLHHYFDFCISEDIQHVFDQVEEICGKSKVIDVLRKFYFSGIHFDPEGNLKDSWLGLKQGTAVAAFLADVILYDLDEYLAKRPDTIAWRYSDDLLVITPTYEDVLKEIKEILSNHKLTLNDKKTQFIADGVPFKFLGYTIIGDQISISKNRLKTFQKEIDKRTIKNRNATLKSAVNAVNRWLYYGNGEYSWASQMLGVINNDHDIDVLNDYVLDSLRAVATGKRKIGGLGYEMNKPDGVITRGKGKNVKANREKTPKEIPGYYSLRTMRNAMLCNRAVYDTLVRQMA